MAELRSTSAFEIEIYTLLLHYREPEIAADALLKKYESIKLQQNEFECLATFLLHCGFYSTLVDFTIKKFDDGSEIPWGHFTEALSLSSPMIDQEIRQAVIEGANSQNKLTELARSSAFDLDFPQLAQTRSQRRRHLLAAVENKKRDLLLQAEMFRSQNLFAEEEQLIVTLGNMFPEDDEIQSLQESLRQRITENVLAQRPKRPKHQVFIPIHQEKDEQTIQLLNAIEQSMHEAAATNPALATDFAIAQLLWENEDASLRLLESQNNSQSQNPQADWLIAESLLRGKKFLELLELLNPLENKYKKDAESFFSIQYLRAQALWGMQQKHLALELLEGLVQARPHYRAAHALLDEWKDDIA